jgi:hypothetical protein
MQRGTEAPGRLLSFLVTTMVYDIGTALKKKVDIVRAMVSTGSSNLLNEVLQNVGDVLAPLD